MSAVLLVALTVGGALADHPANDGQRFSDQPPDVQALYVAVHGANADAQWVIDHNAAIGATAPAVQPGPATVDRSSDDWLRVNHVAYFRSGDLELAARIADSVIMRGTVEEFLAGTDMGVLYGYVPPVAPPPAPRAAPGGGGGGGGGGGTAAPAAPAMGTGLFANIAAADLPQNLILLLRVALTANVQLTTTSVGNPSTHGASMYSISGLPPGLSNANSGSPDQAVAITGTPTATGTYTVTYTATQTELAANVGEGEEADVISSSLTFTIEVVRDAVPAFADGASISDILVLADEVLASVTLPAASGGNGALVYTMTGNPEWLMFDASARTISGTAPDAAAGEVTVTYTVADSDVNTDASDGASLAFTVTVEEDTEPTLSQGNFATPLVEGTDIVPVALAEAAAGNAPYTYKVSGLPNGLSFNAENREVSGRPNVLDEGETSVDITVTYTATDRDGDYVSDTFTITVNAS